ncbi:MAG: hypothetical protein HC804_02770 [Anaerolineae bacterium]|nr:hypothetical protein [Anaerolineae bacterium]
MTEERQIRLTSWVVTLVLLISGIILLSLPFLAWQWTQTPFSGILFDPNLVVNDSGDASWPAQQGSGAAAFPDRVVAINGIPVSNVADVRAVLSGQRVSSNVPFTIVQPPPETGLSPRFDTPERLKSVFLIPITLGDLWEQFWFFYVTGLIMFGMGIWVFRVRPYAEAAQVFAFAHGLHRPGRGPDL